MKNRYTVFVRCEFALAASTQAVAFASIWERTGDVIVEALRSKHFGGPSVLKSIKWDLALQLGHGHKSQNKETTALLEFGVGRPDSDAVRVPAHAARMVGLHLETPVKYLVFTEVRIHAPRLSPVRSGPDPMPVSLPPS